MRAGRAATRWVLVLIAAIGLVACGIGSEATPTQDQSDVLVIVTPTPGTPLPRTPTPLPSEQTYVVRPGDSLSAIANRFGVTEDAIQRANNLTDPNAIYAGQELTIPPPVP